jgi:ATP-dependent helicase/DNAse subunit B
VGQVRDPLAIPAEPAGTVLIRGRIDRIDTLDAPSGPSPDKPDVETRETSGRDAAARNVQAVVLDYKTTLSKRSIRSELLKGERLQAGIYMLALRDLFGMDPAGGLYVGVLPRPVGRAAMGEADNPLNIKMLGVLLADAVEDYDPEKRFVHGLGPTGRTRMTPDELRELLDLTSLYVSAFGRRILEGEIRAVPLESSGSLLPKPCRWCDFRSLCRFDPLRDPILSGHPDPRPSGPAEPGGGGKRRTIKPEEG